MRVRAIKNADKNAKGYRKYKLPEICVRVRMCLIFRVCNRVRNTEKTNYDM